MSETEWRAQPPNPLAQSDWSFPSVERRELDNGLHLLAAQHGSAPLISLRGIVRSGASSDPGARSGLASLTAELLDDGAGNRDAVQLAEDLGRLGAYVASGADWDASYAFVEALADSHQEAIRIFGDILRRPMFSPSAIERVTAERINQITQQRDDASAVAGRLFSRFLFENTRYGTPLIGDPDSVRSIERLDIVGFHSEVYRPANTSIVATGAVPPEQILDLLEEQFGDWESKDVSSSVVELTQVHDPAPIYLIDRPGSVQSEIRIGHHGVPRDTEDYFPIIVMNAILGDLFNSRIMINLRERNGFTYGARSSFVFRRHPGPFVVSTAVRNEVTSGAIDEIFNEIDRIRSANVDDDELELARRYLSGSFPSTVETGADLARRLQEMELYELPSGYFDQYQQSIDAVGSEDVARVARDYLSPESALVVVVGAGSEIAETLGRSGRSIRLFDIDGAPMV